MPLRKVLEEVLLKAARKRAPYQTVRLGVS
jgi:hypothetical protein